MSTDFHESGELLVTTSDVFTSFNQDFISIIEIVLQQYNSRYKDQFEALSKRQEDLEGGQNRKIDAKLKDFYYEHLVALDRSVQSLETAVQGLESQSGQPQQIRLELMDQVEKLREKINGLLKIMDKLVSDLNQMEVKQEELENKILHLEELSKKPHCLPEKKSFLPKFWK